MRAAVLIPAPDFPVAFDWAFEVEAEALRAGGIEVEARPWTELGSLDGIDIVLPLVAWGYHHQPAQWHGLLDRLEGEAAPTLNPVPLLRWNSDKRYLEELGRAGLSVVPTRFVEALDETALSNARGEFGDTLVIKPTMSASADGTHRLTPGDPLPDSALGRAMLVQPYLPAVASEGEYSVMLFGGRFSHSIVKRPKAGDFRVQPHLGGREEPCAAPAGAVELARAALAAAADEAAYARIDMVRLDDGQLAVIELELIEPSLWLQHAPDKGASFAAAILERAQQ